MSEQQPVIIRDQAVADFSHLTSPAELAAISRIEDVALVVVPESLAGVYAAITIEDVASTIFVPDGSNVRVHTGSLVVSGDGIGSADDVLIVVGLLIITSAVTGPVPRQIHVIGSVLAPRGAGAVLGPALAGGTGGILYYQYAEDQDIKVYTGQVKISGAALANTGGGPDDMLMIAGQVVVTGEIAAVGYQKVMVAGQIVAPAASRDVVEPRLQAQGQVAWYEGAEPRVFFDDTTLGADFFRLLPRPVSLVVFGDLLLTPDVSENMIQDKVTGLVLYGDVTAPPQLVGVLQVLATDVFGEIRAAGEPGS